MSLRRAVRAAVVAVVVLTACGAAEKLSPRMAVREAAQATVNQKEGSFRLSLVGSEADINALFNEGAPLTAEDRQGLDVLRNGHISFALGDDKFGLDIKAGHVDHAFELRYVDQKLYARADVAGLAALFGGSAGEVDEAVSGLASQDGFGFLAAAAKGQWIAADLSAANGLFGEKSPASAPQQSEFQAIRDAVGKALSEDLSVKKEGSDGTGDHYVATVSSLRGFYAKVRPVLAQQLTMLRAAQLPPDHVVPDKPASLDVWVKGGRLSRLELDLAQFAPTPPPGAGRVALRLDIDREAAAVTAPADAVTVDLAGLLQKFFSQFGDLLQGVGGGLADYD